MTTEDDRFDSALRVNQAVVDALEPARLDLETIAWQFNEAVSMLREARRHLGDGSDLANEIDEGLPAMQAALQNAVENMKTAERHRRQVEFLEILADGGRIEVNGVPWREMFDRINAIVSDPV